MPTTVVGRRVFQTVAMHMGRPPIEPPANRWRLPAPDVADENGLCGIGADLAPGTLLAAYRNGIFPMPVRKRTLGWWSPDPRGVIPLDGLIVSRSLRRSCRRYQVRFDTNFREVMERCGDSSRPHGWITPQFVDAYEELHRLGWAHSVEAYLDDRLVGGLYGVAIERLFAGESMFSEANDASKVALVALVDRLTEAGSTLLDVQWTTAHLASVGAVDMARDEYLLRLSRAVAQD
ncbi:MAG: leucyl/phenylalanyl-tRNA--protein transferase [Ilumatobacteraceae bacterium]